MKLFSGFAGIGGMDKAFLQVFPGGELVGYSELDPHGSKCKTITTHRLLSHFISQCQVCGRTKKQWASGIYTYQFGEHRNYGDTTIIIPGDLPDFDIYTFGWPCQDNSIAGKRKGQQAGTRSNLLTKAVEILRAKKPRYFVAENVKGLLSVNAGTDIIESFRLLAQLNDSLPQYNIQMQLLNTRWLLPQNRERVFFVGSLRTEPRPEIFPITESDFEYGKESIREGESNIAGTINTKNHSPNWSFDASSTFINEVRAVGYTRSGEGKVKHHLKDEVGTIKPPTGNQRDYIASIMRDTQKDGKFSKIENKAHSIRSNQQQLVQVGKLDEKNSEASRVYDPVGVARTIKNGGGQGAKTGLYVVSKTGAGSSLGNRELNNLPPLRAKDRCDIRLVENELTVRRLTPLECCKLQGFNEVREQDKEACYIKHAIDENGKVVWVPETHQYKAIGNAVTVNIVELIFRKLKRHIDSIKLTEDEKCPNCGSTAVRLVTTATKLYLECMRCWTDDKKKSKRKSKQGSFI